MKRAFDFDSNTKRKAFQRQYNRCAHCSNSLINAVDHAHHVIPNQIGDMKEPDDAFLRSEDNCVILCDPCHNRVHQDGRYRDGAVAAPQEFIYSHGAHTDKHNLWVIQVNAHWDRKFAKKEAR